MEQERSDGGAYVSRWTVTGACLEFPQEKNTLNKTLVALTIFLCFLLRRRKEEDKGHWQQPWSWMEWGMELSMVHVYWLNNQTVQVVVWIASLCSFICEIAALCWNYQLWTPPCKANPLACIVAESKTWRVYICSSASNVHFVCMSLFLSCFLLD